MTCTGLDLIVKSVDLRGIERTIVAPLVTTLSRTTNSYKFLFFKAILDALNVTGNSGNRRNPIPLWEIYALVFVNAWYPVSRFRLSLGATDPLPSFIRGFDAKRSSETHVNAHSTVPLFSPVDGEPDLLELGDQLDRYVKYRFVRPWLEDRLVGIPEAQINRTIATLLQEDLEGAGDCPYHFLPGADGYDLLSVSPRFEEYLEKNAPIIYDWWRWKFATYLASRNPYTPNILNKLEAPLERDMNLARFYWKHVASHGNGVTCIYSGERLTAQFSIDHFIPWSFVAHDRLWNLVPTTAAFNSSKGDGLPDLDKYLEPFLALQRSALELTCQEPAALPQRIQPNIIELEYTILDSQPSLRTLFAEGKEGEFRDLYSNTLNGLWNAAKNQGFPRWHNVG